MKIQHVTQTPLIYSKVSGLPQEQTRTLSCHSSLEKATVQHSFDLAINKSLAATIYINKPGAMFKFYAYVISLNSQDNFMLFVVFDQFTNEKQRFTKGKGIAQTYNANGSCGEINRLK